MLSLLTGGLLCETSGDTVKLYDLTVNTTAIEIEVEIETKEIEVIIETINFSFNIRFS